MSSFVRFIRVGLPLALFVAVLCSGIALPIVQQYKRDLLNELQHQTNIKDKAQQQWSRLLLEQAALSAPGRIERLAQAQLQMQMPGHAQVRELRP